jgi:hypothetical protein
VPAIADLARRRAAAEASIAEAKERLAEIGRLPRSAATGTAFDSALTALSAAHADLEEVERLINLHWKG